MLKLIQAVKNKKGFTLMELIVVLVIIAILIAALTPVLIGWINDARETAIRAEGRTVLLAVQTVFTEAKGTGQWSPGVPFTGWDRAQLLANRRYIDIMTEANLIANYDDFVTTPGAVPGVYSVRLDASGNVVGIVVRNTNRQGSNIDTVGIGYLLVGNLGASEG